MLYLYHRLYPVRLINTKMKFNKSLRFTSYCRYRYNKFCTQTSSDFLKDFNCKHSELESQEIWEKNNYFPIKNSEKDAFTMLLPPPNINGILHLGHALTVSIQDILARWHRMKGHPVVWIPGFDHAGIATQVMVENTLYKTKGISRSDMGREEFRSLIWGWQNEKQNVIKSQLKELGASLDWSKEYFTLSDKHNNSVIEAFVMLSERNLLYRKENIVNWCPALCSTISDIEIERIYTKEKIRRVIPGYDKMITFGEIAYIAFPVKDSKDKIVVATTKPETVFGDVAIAVHPHDERYTKYIGQYVWHPMRKTHIPVIFDPLVDRQFGTGAVKITPAHDDLDYMIGINHKLDIIQVIDEHGKITDAGKQYKGLPRFIAREKVLDEMSNEGMLESINEYDACIPVCSRTQDVIEYLLKEQWFIDCKNMARKAVLAVKNGNLKIIPNVHDELWYHYLNNIRDWCISRQICWGHSIPAYYVTINGKTEWIIARNKNEANIIAEKKYGSNVELHKDQDVLDTWFSSAILPFAVMGWPKQTEDFKKYYPLTLMETGSDILFFWVARMVMLGLELTNSLPFNEVLLHGLLCDSYGKKMSKMKGNIISPENIINGISYEDLCKQVKKNHDIGVISKKTLTRMLHVNKSMFPKGIPNCGADALRMTLCSHNIKNECISFDIDYCEANKRFLNKIWQASKYILLKTDNKVCEKPENMEVIDRWILNKLSLMISTVNDELEQRNFHIAIASIKEFIHHEFCDFYLEATKWGFLSENTNSHISHTYTLRKCIEVSLRTCAPIIPHFSDFLYRRLSNKFPEFSLEPSLMNTPYPLPEQFNQWRDVSLDKKVHEVLNIIQEIRKIILNISKQLKPEVHIVTKNLEDFNIFNDVINIIRGATKMYNVFISLEGNYVKNKYSLCRPYTSDCTIFYVINDSTLFERFLESLTTKEGKTITQRKQKYQKTV